MERVGDKILMLAMFGTLGGPELFLIFVVALVVFGPRKLPEIGKSLGRMMGEFRRASNEFRSTIESEVETEKIREAMRVELPRIDLDAPAAGGTSTPAGQADSPGTAGDPDAPEAPAEPSPEGLPGAVGRGDDSAPIEPK
jgi:Tat protein translocase TatB subunit